MTNHMNAGCDASRSWLTSLIDYILKDSNLMATITEVNATVAEIAEVQNQTGLVLASLDAKLDEVRAFIQSLQVGSPVTQEQLVGTGLLYCAEGVAVASKATSEAVLAETDALDAA